MMCKCRAENDEGISGWSDTVAGVTVENQGPVFAAVAPITVSENIITAIVTVSATDDDAEDDITGYGIVDAADGSAFSIMEATGVLTFNVAPNYESPTDVAVADPANVAGNNEYIVIVEATSGAGDRALTATQTLTVTVTDETEVPGTPSAPTVAEATFNSLKISWTAPTNTGPAISAYDVRYILSSASETDKADDNNWTEVEDAWMSGTGGNLEYVIGSLEPDTGYDIQVRAESDEGTGAWSDTVSGTTSANVAPVITSASSFTVSENSTADVVTVTAADSDTDDNITGYEITGGADESQFEIVSSRGVLTFKTAPDFERPGDSDTDNAYIVIVEATSGVGERELTATQTLTVTVSDVTEVPGTPAAPTIAEATVNSLKIEWTAPTNTGPDISGYDVRYILTSVDENVDANWTEVEDAWTSGNGGNLEYTIGSLDQNTSYDVQVRAESDEGTSAWSSSVTGTTIQNQAPVITSVSSFTVSENITTATTVGTVVATDADEDDGITGYAIITGADGSQFSIVEATGVLTFKVAPNYEAPTDVAVTDPANDGDNNEYIVFVEATGGADSRALTARDTLTITVTDQDNEAPGKPAAPTIAQATFNSLKVSWTAPTNTGPSISIYDIRYILTSASASDKTDDTKWTEVEDAWTSGNGGNLEYTIGSLDQNTSYDVQVRAESDEGISGWSDTVAGVTVENQGPVFAAVAPITVSENIITAIVTVSATDDDAEDDITGYGIVDAADGSAFSIVEATGVLTFNVAPNYESPTDVAVADPANVAGNNEYIVAVSATGGAGDRALTTTQIITVTVTDVNEAPDQPATPTIAEATFNSLKVEWSAPTNTGPDISAYDVRYTLTNADETDDANWTVVEDAWTSGSLEYTIGSLDQNTSYDVQVRAENDEGMSAWSATVKGTTIQNQAPVITSVPSFTVSENITTATTVGTVVATDADADDSITGYAIATGADGSQFSIGEATGVLTFKEVPNYEDPKDVAFTDPDNSAHDNVANNNEYIVIVSAMSGADARALTARDTIKVTVTDVNEKPVFSSAMTFEVAENEQTVRTVVADDEDADDSITSYAITGGDDQAQFSLVAATGALTFNTAPNYEASADADNNNAYILEVTATGGAGVRALTEVQTITVTVTDENEGPVFAAVSPPEVDENSTGTVVTVTATDEDADDSITGYGIVDDADGSQFSIDGTSGVLTFKEVPNYEDPEDVAFTDPDNSANDNVAGNNEYIVIVSATGGAGARVLTAMDTIKVTVTNVPGEKPGTPATPTITQATFNSLKVNWTAPTNTGPAISAYDVRYILTSADETDDANWTVITDAWTSGTGGALEYTISPLAQDTEYDVQILAESDEGTSDWSDTVKGMTSVNVAPVITSTSSFTVSENITTATTVGTVSATDADADDSITGYAIVTGADRSQFSLGEATGVLTFKSSPNYEDPEDVAFTDANNSDNDNAADNNEYIVIVEATGGENARVLTVRDTLTITVTDVTEPPAAPAVPTIAEATFNSLKVEWTAPTNTGPAISAYDIRYILTSADENVDANWTEVEEVWTSGNGGNLEYTISSLDQNTSYDVQVRAENDEGISDWSDTVAGVIQANVAPVISSASTFTVSENSTADVVTVTAADSDTDDNITGYEITGGADGSQFEIDDQTGALTFKTAPDFEHPGDVVSADPVNASGNNEYIVVVEATSGAGDRELTATQTITVTVTDVETEAPDVPATPTIAEATFNSLKVEWTAPENTGPSITAYDVRYILSSATDEDKADDANWTVAEEVWTSGDTDLEYTIGSLSQNTSYDVQVRAESDEGTGDWSDTVSGTTSANQAPVITSASSFTVSENSTADVVTVTAADSDTDDTITGYEITGGADESQFEIVSGRGVLTFKTAPDFERPGDSDTDNAYIVIVEATSGAGDRELTATQTLTVTVSDVETEAPGVPAAPTIAEATFNSLKVSWTAPTNTGPAISGYDVRYILSSASATDKADDNNWTEVEDAWTSGALEYTISALDQNTGYDIQVRAESDEGTSDWSASATGTTSANVAPVITSASSFTVQENITTATTVVTVTATDEDDDIERYAIVDDADGSQFSIVEATGVLTFKAVPNYESPTDVEVTDPANAEENNEYIVIVTATSGAGDRELTARATLTITVTDVDTEAPGTPDTPTIAEATVNSLKIEWTAPTNTGPAISGYDVRYILTSADENVDANWTEVEDAWTSGSGGNLEYTIGSLSQNTSYDVQVRAENDEGTSGWSSSVAGTTEANVAPVFTSVSAETVSENSTAAIVTVTATDADVGDDITEYGIVTGADGAQFEIDDQTGVLSFKEAPNYESPTDVAFTDAVNPSNNNAANNNEYIVYVEATGGENARALTARDTLTITVTDVTEKPGTPSAPTVAEATFNSLKVVWNAPTNTGPTISAYDVRYILTSEDENVDANWTVEDDAWTSGDLTYTIENLSSNTSYDVQVRAENAEGTSDWSATKAGMTTQNQAPVFVVVQPQSVNENSTADIVTVSATDADEDDNITGYAIVDDADGSQFSIGEATGVLTFKAVPNYEDPKDVAVTDPENDADNNEYIVFVEATGGADSRALTATQTLTVTVTDETEAPGTPSAPTIAEATFNSLKVEWTAPMNTGPEISAYDVRYILSSASETDKTDDSKWTVVEDAWTSGTGGALEYTISPLAQNTEYDIQVRAESDEGTSGWSDSVEGMTTENVAPVITSASSFTVSENSTADIVTVSASDSDTGDDIESYGIATGADGDQFSIGASTGVLTFKASPNYEVPTDVLVSDPSSAAGNNEYIVYVTATGGEDARALTARDTLKVTVTDVDTEKPGTPATPTIAEATFNSLKVNWTAPTNTGPAISSYDVRYILTSADETDDANWTVEDDAWTSGSLEYTISSLSQNTGYDVQVRAENDEGTSSWSSSVAGTTKANVAPVFTSVSAISVNENSTGAIVTVTATDSDDTITGYAITGGVDKDQFEIVSSTGVLSFKTAPDYERPEDVVSTDPANAEKNNKYIVVVEATGGAGDRALTATQTLTMTVSDVNEAPGVPDPPTVSASTLNSLTVEWTAPDNTGPAIIAYDVRYILTSADENVDANWTEVEDVWTSNNGGNLEYTISSLDQNTSYDVQVRAESDEGTSDWSATRTGMTSQNQAPTFSDGTSTTRSFAENTAAEQDIGNAVSATDIDAGKLDYTLEGTDANSFAIVETSGQLKTKTDVTYDYETKNSYSVTVKVVDGQGGSATIAVTVSLTDVNEAPVFSSAASVNVAENTKDEVTVTATDVDNDDSITGYAITGGVDKDQFEITSGGVLSFKTAPDFESPDDVLSTTPLNDAANNAYIVIVTATGGADERALTAAQTNTVTVTDVTEPPAAPAAPTIAETTFNSLKVSWTAPTNTGPAISAYDVRYILSSASDTDKADDTKWTEVEDAWTSGSLEYTIRPLVQNTGYDIQVRAENAEGTSAWSDSATGMTEIAPGICDRTQGVQTAILSAIAGVTDCALVTDTHLAGITGPLVLSSQSITALQESDFSGLSSLERLELGRNNLSALPDQVFSGLSSLERLELGRNSLSALPDDVFSGLSSLQILRLESNQLSALPDDVFSGLSSLQILNLKGNSLSILSDSIFFGLSSLSNLDLSKNTGAPFTLTLMLERIDNADLAAMGPATVVVKVAEGAPFDMTVSLSVTNGTLMDANMMPISQATISKGSIESQPITVTQSGTAPVIVSMGSAPALPANYTGLQTSAGTPLNLFLPGICARTQAVQTAILSVIAGVTDCALVTDMHLTEIMGTLDFRNQSITALQESDFSSLSSLQTLHLGSNQLTQLPDDVFSSLSSLQTLHLGSNRLSALPDDVFSGLSSLQTLNLESNRLSALPDDVFSGLSSLQTLNLESNQLTQLPDDVFSGLSSLQTLNLESNRLSALPDDVFSGLSSLQTLYLNRNKLSTLPDGVFSGLSSLQTLYLNRNKLSTLPDGVFSGLSSLQTLHLHNNESSSFILTLALKRTDNADLTAVGPATVVAKVAQGAPFDMTIGLSATDGTLTDENMMPISQATISKGSIESQPITVTQSGTAPVIVSMGFAPEPPPDDYIGLRTTVGASLVLFLAPGICGRTPAVRTAISSAIDGVTDCALVMDTHLTEITGTLDLRNQSITALQENDFSSLSSLQTLWLYDNLLSTLSANVFSGLSNLQTLSLYRNQLLELPDGAFSNLSNLQTLYLEGNRLNTLPGDVFSNLSSLQTLNLEDNGLRELPGDVFSNLSSLQILNLEDNGLRELPDDTFSNLSNLQTLRLGSNDLEVSGNLFTGLSNLRFLSLDINHLSTLPNQVFSGLSSLQTLSLSGNTLSTLPHGVFSDLSNLKFLSLDGNALGTLPDRVFSGLSNLQTLNLSGNTLSALPDSAFFDLSDLQILNLKGNMLSILPDSMFFGLSSLRNLDVSGNTGASFTLTLVLERTDNADLTAQGPATVVVKVAEGAPFDMTVSLSATNSTLTDKNMMPISQATISRGSIQSESITVTQSGTTPVRVNMRGRAPDLPAGYEGIRTTLGTSLVLFGVVENRAPEAMGSIAAQTLKAEGNAVIVDVKNNFLDPDGDNLNYTATSNMPGVASVSVTGSEVQITPVGAGHATVTVTASDQTNSATQKFEVVVKNTAPVVYKGLTDQTAFSGNAFTYTFPADAFSDADNDALTYTSSGQPAWLTFTPSSRTFSGTPTNTDGSPFTITVTADDSKGSRVQARFTLTIPIGICSRTSQIQTAILSVIDGIDNCAHVTEEHLAGIVDSLDLRSQSITALQANDFSGMHNLRILNFYDNDLTTLPSEVFYSLSNLRFLSLDSNRLSELPSEVFYSLSNLRFLSLNNNALTDLPVDVFSRLSNLQALGLIAIDKDVDDDNDGLTALPAGVFSGLSSLSHLDVSGNTGAPFTLTLALERIDKMDLITAGPATVVVKVAQGAPYDMTVRLSATDAALTDENGDAITEVTISRSNIQSEPITVTQNGTTSTTVSLGPAPVLPANYVGLQIAVGTSIVLFGQADQ